LKPSLTTHNAAVQSCWRPLAQVTGADDQAFVIVARAGHQLHVNLQRKEIAQRKSHGGEFPQNAKPSRYLRL